MSDSCVFCQIVQKQLPTTVRYENDDVLAFDNIQPKAATHILVIPKRHIEHMGTATKEDDQALAALLPAVREIATQLKLDGFKMAVNNGVAYGQSVAHLHIHLLSGQFAPDALKSL